jgi:hypothetical protein
MKKKISIFLVFIAIFAILHAFWPFGKRKFNVKAPFPVAVADNGNYFATVTSAATVSDFLQEKNIALGNKDYVFPAPEAKIFPDSQIVIRHAVPVTIAVDGKNIQIDTLGTNIGDAIKEANVSLSPVDKVAPDPSQTLSANLKIIVTRINITEIEVNDDIPFQVVQKEDNSVLWKHNAVTQKGVNGIREKKYRVTYTDGKETNRVLIGTTVTQAPVSEIDSIGTKIIVGKTQLGDATWYVNGNDLTCASLTFAQGKYLRVTNKSNGKSVIVQVNDSGPYGKGRVIDLNKKAFQKISDIGAGVINVKVEEILN